MLTWLRRLILLVFAVAVFGASTWGSFLFFVRGRSVTVPKLIGEETEKAARLAQERGLALVVERGKERFDDKIPLGHVLEQKPRAGNDIKSGQRVRVALSKGPRILTVPDLQGGTLRTAQLSLNRLGLKVGTVSYTRSASGESHILAHEPPPETVVARETLVNLLIAEGRTERAYVMPDLIQRDSVRVRDFFFRSGFRIGNIKYESYEGIPANLVLRQFPLAGYPLQSGDVISLVVSRGEAAAAASEIPRPAASEAAAPEAR